MVSPAKMNDYEGERTLGCGDLAPELEKTKRFRYYSHIF